MNDDFSAASRLAERGIDDVGVADSPRLVGWRPLTTEEGEGRVWANEAATQAVVLSVCVPYFRYDIGVLLAELLRQASEQGSVEIVLADDGSDEPATLERIVGMCSDAPVNTTLLVFARNIGRAAIRNRLAARARGTFTLFLDADMVPDSPGFLATYLQYANVGEWDIVVGGRSYEQVHAVPPSQRLYHHYSLRTECLPAAARQATGWRHVFTNNIMVRTALLTALPFDPGYAGWGYEDTDWALRAMHVPARVMQIDNTATHLGMIDDNVLVQKYEESVFNFRRVSQKFPAELSRSPVFRLARLLRRLHLPRRAIGACCRSVVLARSLPLSLRYRALQVYKATLYSAVVDS